MIEKYTHTKPYKFTKTFLNTNIFVNLTTASAAAPALGSINRYSEPQRQIYSLNLTENLEISPKNRRNFRLLFWSAGVFERIFDVKRSPPFAYAGCFIGMATESLSARIVDMIDQLVVAHARVHFDI